ncbi:MAG: Gldg family protein [Treponema sp.]|nr:Gldg family protein [Treponema sp.]
MKKFIAWLKNPQSDIFLFAVLLILINLVASKSFFRVDLTSSKSFTLSKSSKEIVSTLEEPLSIKVFFSSNLPPQFAIVDTYVRDLLVEYEEAGDKNLTVEYFDLKSDASEYNDENYQIAHDYGLHEFQTRELKNNEVSYKNIFMGLVFTYADQIEILDGINSTSGLEYKITTAISKIIYNTNALAGLDGKIKLTLYKSDSLNAFRIANLSNVENAVSEAFNKINTKYNGRLEFEKVNADTKQAEDASRDYGVQELSWKDKDGEKVSGAFGLVLSYGDKVFTVPVRIQNMIFQWAVLGLESIEENINQGILNLVSKTSSIAYSTGHGEHDSSDNEEGAGNFAAMLGDVYSLEDLNLAENDIPANVTNLIINGAKGEFTDAELYKIDQFVLSGGNLIIFTDSYDIVMPQTKYQQPQFMKINNGLEKLLTNYGVTTGENYVFDKECYSTDDDQYGKVNLYYIPVLKKESLNQDHAITNNLNYVFFINASAIDTTAAENDENVKVTVLAKSSTKAWESTDPSEILNLRMIFPPEDDKLSQKNLAVLLEGKFKSAFDKNPSESEENSENTQNDFTVKNHIAESTQSGKVLVIPTSLITTSQIISSPNSNTPVALFLRNAVDYMNGNEDFCLMRTKALSMNELEESSLLAERIAEWFNKLGLAVLVAVAGILVLLARKNKKDRIRQFYNPEDPRQISKEEQK